MSGIDDLLVEPPKCASDHVWNNAVREAYRRGRQDGKATIHDCGQHSMACCTAGYQRGYTAGYNDRARSAVHTYQMYGIPEFNQHGGGTNP